MWTRVVSLTQQLFFEKKLLCVSSPPSLLLSPPLPCHRSLSFVRLLPLSMSHCEGINSPTVNQCCFPFSVTPPPPPPPFSSLLIEHPVFARKGEDSVLFYSNIWCLLSLSASLSLLPLRLLLEAVCLALRCWVWKWKDGEQREEKKRRKESSKV